nr:enoyl-CoA hydratase-related protein [Pseudomonas sp. Hg5Tf]MDH2561893.1 enoyl-CoA hydratase-related protein [Pseudomonas sp. Hg5Tf]
MAIQFKIIEHVALITLDGQPSTNTLSVSELMHLRKTLSACQDDEQVRVIVVTGAGGRAFCSGVNLNASLRTVPGYVGAALKSREAEAEEGVWPAIGPDRPGNLEADHRGNQRRLSGWRL